MFTSKGSTSSSKSSKSSILRKKLQAEKLALELKIAEKKCEEEIKLFRAEAERRVVVLELRKKAEESKLEYEFEDALAKEDFVSNNANIIDEELSELPVDSVNDRVSRLGTNSAPVVQNAEADEQFASKVNQSRPGNGTKELETQKINSSSENKPPACDAHATGTPSFSVNTIEQLFKNILPAFVKIVKPSVPKFNGNPLGYSKFKAALKVEVDKWEVYDDIEKLKFLLDAVEGSAKSCLAKFMPGSDRYLEAWKALDERLGRLDTVVSVAKKRVNQFPAIVKEKSEQIRQYQEIVPELIGVYKEHFFIHELKSQIPETCVAKPPVRLCGKCAEFVEGKSQLSTWESFASWLEREARISESKQRWMLEKKDWRRPDSVRSGVRKIGDHSVAGLFAGATGENSSRTNNVAVKCPVHESTNHKLQECKVFERMSAN